MGYAIPERPIVSQTFSSQLSSKQKHTTKSFQNNGKESPHVPLNNKNNDDHIVY